MIHDRIENLEQHESGSDRREFGERRILRERRFDSRRGLATPPKKIKFWLQSVYHPRLGVDRRKVGDRRQQWQLSGLTPEELSDFIC